jgi:pimeloyl-[acyl-carrier protein] methyl ester esterase
MPLVTTMMLGRYGSPAIRNKLSVAMESVLPSVWKVRAGAALNTDATAQFREIDAPMLYLRASKDRIVSRSMSEVMLRQQPKMKIVEIEGPHFLLQAKPREAAIAIKTFAAECGIDLNIKS